MLCKERSDNDIPNQWKGNLLHPRLSRHCGGLSRELTSKKRVVSWRADLADWQDADSTRGIAHLAHGIVEIIAEIDNSVRTVIGAWISFVGLLGGLYSRQQPQSSSGQASSSDSDVARAVAIVNAATPAMPLLQAQVGHHVEALEVAPHYFLRWRYSGSMQYNFPLRVPPSIVWRYEVIFLIQQVRVLHVIIHQCYCECQLSISISIEVALSCCFSAFSQEMSCCVQTSVALATASMLQELGSSLHALTTAAGSIAADIQQVSHQTLRACLVNS